MRNLGGVLRFLIAITYLILVVGEDDPVFPSRRDNIPDRGPPPKQFRPTRGSGWGYDLFPGIKLPPPPSSSEEKYWSRDKPGWAWAQFISTKPPKSRFKGWGWGSWAERRYYSWRRFPKGWGSGGDSGEIEFTTKRPKGSGWGWYTSEKPWSHSERPGWVERGPCCQSGHPYFKPSWGPHGPPV